MISKLHDFDKDLGLHLLSHSSIQHSHPASHSMCSQAQNSMCLCLAHSSDYLNHSQGKGTQLQHNVLNVIFILVPMFRISWQCIWLKRTRMGISIGWIPPKHLHSRPSHAVIFYQNCMGLFAFGQKLILDW